MIKEKINHEYTFQNFNREEKEWAHQIAHLTIQLKNKNHETTFQHIQGYKQYWGQLKMWLKKRNNYEHYLENIKGNQQ